MAKKSPKTVDFENALKSLEAIVQTLEKGDLSLEEALTQYEQGISLAKDCQQALQNAELKVKTLMQEQAQLIEPAENASDVEEQDDVE